MMGLIILAVMAVGTWWLLDERPTNCKLGFHTWENLTKDLGFVWFDIHKCKGCGKTHTHNLCRDFWGFT